MPVIKRGTWWPIHPRAEARGFLGIRAAHSALKPFMEKSLLMLGGLNKGLPIFASLLVASGILFSLVAIILPILVGEDLGLEELDAMGRMQGFRAEGLPAHASPGDSPYVAPLRITTPPLKETDSLVLRIFGEGRELGEIDCLGEMESWAGITELECNATIPYNYQNSENYKLYAVLTREEGEYAYGPLEVRADWGAYEDNFWGFTGNTLICAGGAFLLLVDCEPDKA